MLFLMPSEHCQSNAEYQRMTTGQKAYNSSALLMALLCRYSYFAKVTRYVTLLHFKNCNSLQLQVTKNVTCYR